MMNANALEYGITAFAGDDGLAKLKQEQFATMASCK